MANVTCTIIVGRIIHCLSPFNLKVIEDGFIIVEHATGKILAVGNENELQKCETTLNVTRKELIKLTKTQLLLPGLIDTHIHAPQYPNAGLGYDRPLLEWLDKYTYQLEKKYSDQELCQKVFNAVVRKTLDYGTTTACYFGSLFANSTMVLVDAVAKHGQRAFVGKINMILLAPPDYIETKKDSIANTLKFISDVKSKNNPLIQPVITPRFALSCDMELMEKLGQIAKQQNLNIQSHISENLDEITLVKNTFSESYANVYDKAGLLTPKTVLAHGVHLTKDELALISKTGTSISHCPESNTNLKSGLCDVVELSKNNVTVGLGTDVAGGASPSIISAMRSAIGVSNHISFMKPNYTSLNYADVFYMATLGGAKALAIDSQVGNFEVGKQFDAIIVDLDVAGSSADYLFKSNTPEELLQKFVYLGDDRNVLKVYVDGRLVK